MTKPGYTISQDKQQQIWQAADALAAAGTSVTMRAVKEHMGGGSFSYISPVLRAWKEARKPRFRVGDELPEELQLVVSAAVSHIAQRFHESFTGLADECIERATGELDYRLAAVNSQLAEMESECATLETERDREVTQREHLSQINADQNNEIKLLNSRLIELTETLGTLEATLAQRENQLNDAQHQLQLLQKRHEQRQEQAEKDQIRLAALEQKLEASQCELSNVLKQNAAHQAMLASSLKQLETRDQRIEALREDLVVAERETQGLRMTVTALETKLGARKEK